MTQFIMSTHVVFFGTIKLVLAYSHSTCVKYWGLVQFDTILLLLPFQKWCPRVR